MKKTTILFMSLFFLHANAQFTDYLTNLGSIVGMAKTENTLYIGSVSESKILYVDLNAPTPVAQDFIIGISFPTKFVVIDDELYFTYGLNDVGKIDLSSPTPQLEFVINIPGAFGLASKDNFIYVGDRNNGQILKFDYTVPSPATELVADNLGGFMGDIAFNGNDLFVARGSDNVISKIDVSIPNPPIVDVIEAEGVLDMAFNGDDMYYSNNYLNRLNINSSVPNPEILAFNVTAIWDILFDGNDIFLAQQTDQKIITTNIANLSPITFTNNSFALDEITANNLPTTSQGATAMADVDGDNDLDLFITGNNQGSYIAKLYLNDGTGLFTESLGNTFEGVAGNSSVAFADVDGDTDQDVLYFGLNSSFTSRITKLYLNDGSGNFIEDTANNFIGISRGDITFGDIDGDNDQDLILSGEIGANGYVKLFLNNGSGNYTETTNNQFQQLSSTAVSFSDVDNDSDLDVLVTGFNPTTQSNVAELYVNDGSGNFTLVANTPFTGVVRGMIKFADLDGDLDDDVIIAGQIDNNNLGSLTRIYTNDGNGNFTADFLNNLIDLQEGSVGTTDIDGDGDLDLLLGGLETTGTNTFESKISLYFNDGNGNFIEDNLFSAPGVYQMDYEFFADIDNDGDDDVFLFSTNFNTAQTFSKVYRHVPPIPESERNALLAFYNATDGDNWIVNNNWNTRFSAGMWQGVTTVNNNVTQLDFFGDNGLNGTLPDEIGDFQNLEILNISLNPNLTGPLPESLGNLTNLTQLNLQWNNHTGAIPQSIGNMSQLEVLRLLWNDLSGSLPSSLGNLSNLRIIELDGVNGNAFSGAIPSTFGNLINLESLSIGNNNLDGELPSSLSNLSNLLNVNLTNNNFTGSIPFNSVSASLDLSNNLFNFADLEPFNNSGNFSSLVYSPQRTTDPEQDIESGVGSNITLSVTLDDLNRNATNSAQNNEFQWFKDNTAISDANSSSYTITNAQTSDSGVYYCEITNSILPDLTIIRAPITVTVDASLGIEDHDKDEISIYPNPVSNWLHINSGQNLQNTKAEIYNIDGKLVLEFSLKSNTNSINIETISDGIYILKIYDDNRYSKTMRFIKQ